MVMNLFAIHLCLQMVKIIMNENNKEILKKLLELCQKYGDDYDKMPDEAKKEYRDLINQMEYE